MHTHLVGLKLAIANTAAVIVPAMAAVSISETAAQAQIADQALLRTAAKMSIVSCSFAMAWYAFLAIRLFLAWWRSRRNDGEGGTNG